LKYEKRILARMQRKIPSTKLKLLSAYFKLNESALQRTLTEDEIINYYEQMISEQLGKKVKINFDTLGEI
jgi:hypothetical protein